jgi:hypothetical protein
MSEEIQLLIKKFSKLTFSKELFRINSAIIIQKCWRGYKCRKQLQKLSDNMTPNLLNYLLKQYIQYIITIEKINEKLTKKKCRNPNFPSEVSENICKFAIYRKYKIMPNWDTNTGDLELLQKKIEVKGFMSDGPSSFGPTEKWNYIYFVDCRDYKNKNFKVFEIKLANTDLRWRLIRLTKENNYGQIADNNKRGQLRACFYNVFKPQLKEHCKLIFDGSLNELFNK